MRDMSDARSASAARRPVAASDEPASVRPIDGGWAPEAPAPSIADWAWAAACAAALLPVTVVELVQEAGTEPDIAWLAGTIALFVVLHVTVAMRRRSPRLALLVASTVMFCGICCPEASVVGLPPPIGTFVTVPLAV